MPAQYDKAYTDYQTQRSGFRRLVRRLYMNKAQSLLTGRTLDLGCGVGDLLSQLPPGSLGLEYNRATVDHCQQRGLPVRWYDGQADGWQLTPALASGPFQSLVISHVLEHFDHPALVLQALAEHSPNLGVSQMLIIVPGSAGFASDPTHRTMIDLPWIQRVLQTLPEWQLIHAAYFPFNHAAIGNHFTHNELQVLLERPARLNTQQHPI